MHLLRDQRLEIEVLSAPSTAPPVPAPSLSRAQRAHYRLSFPERLARNARGPTPDHVTLSLFGVPEAQASWLGLPHM